MSTLCGGVVGACPNNSPKFATHRWTFSYAQCFLAKALGDIKVGT